MEVPGTDNLIPVINTYIKHFSQQGWPIIATRDWHPAHHAFFIEQQGPWPVHCVQGSYGAQFHSDLVLPPGMLVISKGTDSKKDAISGFDGTTLADRLEDLDVKTLYVLGPATQDCLKHTILDACQLGFTVVILKDAVGKFSETSGDSVQALGEILVKEALRATASDLGITLA